MQMGDDLVGDEIDDNFGKSVSLSSDGLTLAVGSPGSDNNIGKIKVYNSVNNMWVQIGSDLVGEFVGGKLGSVLDLNSNGTILAVGYDSLISATVKIYENIDNNWIQIGDIFLVNNNPNTFTNVRTKSVSLNLDGSIIAIGVGVFVGQFYISIDFTSIYKNYFST